MLAAISEAALTIQALVAECPPEAVTDTATQVLPLVIALPLALHQDKQASFEALARDIRASLFVVGPGPLDVAEVEATLADCMQEAEQKRPSWTGDRLSRT
ncbi:MAG: hypothetical protein AAGA56_03695 [Myxococcota bacterium]